MELLELADSVKVELILFHGMLRHGNWHGRKLSYLDFSKQNVAAEVVAVLLA